MTPLTLPKTFYNDYTDNRHVLPDRHGLLLLKIGTHAI